MTLTEFLEARIAEDEAVARGAIAHGEGSLNWGDDGDPTDMHVARWDPARVLAECEAKRAIVKRAQHIESMGDQSGSFTIADLEYDEHILPALALPYADHPSFQQAWTP